MDLSRRHFLGTSAAAVIAGGTMAKGQVYGANEKVNVCVIGIRGRGGSHINGYIDCPDAEVVALCDVDERVLRARVKEVERKTGKKPKAYSDMRDAFADPEIDAVSIATPNHWHTLATVWACEAGKDVYVEKPATHNIWEGKQLIAAAKKYGRIVQHGTQRRSERIWIRDIQLLQSGEIIGPLYMARGLGYKNGNRGSLGFKEDSAPPAHLDWRKWQGPATERPFNANYVPYNWHWFWHYGNGELGNQGIHQLDVAVWGMNRGMPTKVTSSGGRYTYDDQGETPNTNVATFTYEDGTMLVFEVRNRFTNDEAGVRVGNLFYGDEGYYVENKGFFDKKDQPIKVSDKDHPLPESAGCWQNFINSVKSRDEKSIFGGPMECHLASGHAHLANTAYRLGRSLEFDTASETFKNDDEANTYIKRDYEKGFEVPELA